MKYLSNSNGFVLVEVVFLTLIVSFTAMLIVRGYKTTVLSNQNSALRTAALNVAQAQIAEIESRIYRDDNKELPISFDLLDENFLIYEDFFGIKGKVKFIVNTTCTTLSDTPQIKGYSINIKVYWQINNSNIDNNIYEEINKNIWFKVESINEVTQNQN